MSTDHLGEARVRALSHLERSLAGLDSQATIGRRAGLEFEGAVAIAVMYHQNHSGEESAVHQAALAEPFVRLGVPALDALQIVEILFPGGYAQTPVG